jgi:hypothetical protein
MVVKAAVRCAAVAFMPNDDVDTDHGWMVTFVRRLESDRRFRLKDPAIACELLRKWISTKDVPRTVVVEVFSYLVGLFCRHQWPMWEKLVPPSILRLIAQDRAFPHVDDRKEVLSHWLESLEPDGLFRSIERNKIRTQVTEEDVWLPT